MAPKSKVDETSLRKYMVPEFVFGEGARFLVGRYARNFGARKALVVTDPGIIAAGWVQHVLDSLEEEAIPFVLFSGVSSNPRAEQVMAGAELYAREECNIIVAVGGGSPTDCAKGIGIVSSNRNHILSFQSSGAITVPMPPLICVPTTMSSADVSQFAVITDEENRLKVSIISKALIPDLSLSDPWTLTSMPPKLAASVGYDALSHAIEAYVSTASSPFTDLHALEAISLLASGLVGASTRPSDIGVQKLMMQGALHAGIAFSNASLGAMHAMVHSLGGTLDLAHGDCNAMLLEHVVEFNFDAVPDKYRMISRRLGLNTQAMSDSEIKKKLKGTLGRLRREIGIQTTLAQVGVRQGDIPRLASKALEDPCMITNPVWPQQRDVEEIYEKAL